MTTAKHGEVDSELHIIVSNGGALRLQCEKEPLLEDQEIFWTEGDGSKFIPEDHPHPCRSCYPETRKEPSETTKRLQEKFGHKKKDDAGEGDDQVLEDGITCPECPKTCKNAQGLAIHRRKAHGVPGAGRSKAKHASKNGDHKCPHCPKAFGNPYALAGHKRIHKNGSIPVESSASDDTDDVVQDLVIEIRIPAAAVVVLNGQTAKIEGLLHVAARDMVREQLEKHQTAVAAAIKEVAA